MESDDNNSVAGTSEGLPSPQSCATGYSSDTNPSLSSHSTRPDSVPASSTSETQATPPAFGENGLSCEVKSFNFATNSSSICTSPTFSFSGSSTLSPGLSKSGSASSLSSLSKNKKKKQTSTNRPQPSKSKVIKFHEYKGPPNVVKNQTTQSQGMPSSPVPLPVGSLAGALGGMESPYHVMLHQQQMMLQWQLEVQQKNLNFLVPTAKLLSPEQRQLSHLSPGSSQSASSSPGSVSSSSIQPLTPGSATVQVGIAKTGSGQQSVTPQPIPSPFSMGPSTPVSPPQTQTPTPVSLGSVLSPVTSPQAPPAPPPPPPPPPPPLPPIIPPPLPPPPSQASTTLKTSIVLPVSSSTTSAFTIPKTEPLVIATGTTGTASVISSTGTAKTNSKVNTSSSNQTSASQSTGTPSTSSTGGGNGSNNKVTKLEDLKVADLKAECKKRSLPVSGPKPNLLNKLALYAAEIVEEYKLKYPTYPPSKNNSNSKSSSVSEKQSTKTPPNSAGSTGSLNSVFASLTSEDATMMPISPPSSPSNGLMDLNASIASVMSTPLSPPEESMDIQLNPSVKNSTHTTVTSSEPVVSMNKTILSRSSTITPMAVDPQSRPPSVTPMDIDMNSSSASQSLANMLPVINQGQIIQNVTSSISGQQTALNSMGTSSGIPGASFTVSMTKVTQPQIATQMQNSAVKIGPSLQRATMPAVSAGGKLKPVQLQISSSAAQVRPATAIVKQIPVSSSTGVAQIHIPVSQIQPPIKVPIQVSSTTQAKVKLPPGQIHIPVSGQPGQIAVPVSGTLPMSAEVSIPVSGGTIQIPVSQLPPHLQQQVTIQIHQQLQQQAVNALAAIKKGGGPSPQSIIINKAPIAKVGQNTISKVNINTKAGQGANKTSQASKTMASGKSNGNTKVVQANQIKAKTTGKPKIVKGKGNGKVNKNATKNEVGPGTTETQIALTQLAQPSVLDTKSETNTSLITTVNIKEEKPCSPYQHIDTTPEAKTEIKLEPASSPTAISPQHNGTSLVSQSQDLLQHMTQSNTILQKAATSLSPENLVAEQQKQIEELRQQLLQSQLKLQDAQNQAQQHQEQLRKLTLAKIASMTQQNALNSLLMEQAKTQAQIQALTLAQNDQINQLAQHNATGVSGDKEANNLPTNLSPQISGTQMVQPIQTSLGQFQLDASQKTSTAVSTNAASPENKSSNLTSLLQTQGLHKIDLSQTKIVQVINANGQPQFVLTSQPSSKSTVSVTNSLAESMTSVVSPSK